MGFTSLDRQDELTRLGGGDTLAEADLSSLPFKAAYNDLLEAMCKDTSFEPYACSEDIEAVALGVIGIELDDSFSNAVDRLGGEFRDLTAFIDEQAPPAVVISRFGDRFGIDPPVLEQPGTGDGSGVVIEPPRPAVGPATLGQAMTGVVAAFWPMIDRP